MECKLTLWSRRPAESLRFDQNALTGTLSPELGLLGNLSEYTHTILHRKAMLHNFFCESQPWYVASSLRNTSRGIQFLPRPASIEIGNLRDLRK